MVKLNLEGKALTDSNSSSLEIPALYQQCLENETKWAKLDIKKLKLIFRKSFLVHDSLFRPPPTRSESLGSSKVGKEREFKISMRLYEGEKYRDILELLARMSDKQARLLFIARWLAEEKVCEPEDIIGTEELQRQAQKICRWIPEAAFHHADRVRAWIPYFERLLDDFRIAKGTGILIHRGYERSAIQASYRKHSAIEAACEWLVTRDKSLNVDPPTLRNAYSQIYGRIPRSLRLPHRKDR